jgi:hypothetical protein
LNLIVIQLIATYLQIQFRPEVQWARLCLFHPSDLQNEVISYGKNFAVLQLINFQVRQPVLLEFDRKALLIASQEG